MATYVTDGEHVASREDVAAYVRYVMREAGRGEQYAAWDAARMLGDSSPFPASEYKYILSYKKPRRGKVDGAVLRYGKDGNTVGVSVHAEWKVALAAKSALMAVGVESWFPSRTTPILRLPRAPA